MRTGRQALVRAVGRGSREQVVVLDVVMMSKMWEESMGEKAVREGGVVWSGRGRGTGMVVVEELQTAAVRKLLIWEILLLKASRKVLQRSGEEGGLMSAGWSSLLTVENRLRGFRLALLMRVEKWVDLAAWRASR